MACDNRHRTVPVMCYVVSMVRFLWENLSLLQRNLKAHLGLGSPTITRIAHDLLHIGREECLVSAVANGLGTLQDLVKARETFVSCSITGIGVYHTKRKGGNFGHC